MSALKDCVWPDCAAVRAFDNLDIQGISRAHFCLDALASRNEFTDHGIADIFKFIRWQSTFRLYLLVLVEKRSSLPGLLFSCRYITSVHCFGPFVFAAAGEWS